MAPCQTASCCQPAHLQPASLALEGPLGILLSNIEAVHVSNNLHKCGALAIDAHNVRFSALWTGLHDFCSTCHGHVKNLLPVYQTPNMKHLSKI